MNPFKWLRTALTFVIAPRQTPVAPEYIKAGAEAVVDEARFRFAELGLRLQRKELLLAEFDIEGRRLIKVIHTANAALARGGWAQMRPADYERAAELVARQYGFWQERMQVAAKGLYGPEFNRKGFLGIVGQYADAGRATYENTRLQVMKEGGAVEARRVLAAADHCADCVAWAALDWIPIEDMESEYPIGSGECRHNCRCVIVTRKVRTEFVSLP
jgi:hypothetical protein